VSKVFLFLPHEQFQPEEIVEQAKLAEKAGFDGVMVSEHFNPWSMIWEQAASPSQLLAQSPRQLAESR
jgi:alkanesulfonate monooxygenase SsuD/methylene tetrahydromethanopterin reductase-like flavin-dependent oxidoreductase (luciferase family)